MLRTVIQLIEKREQFGVKIGERNMIESGFFFEMLVKHLCRCLVGHRNMNIEVRLGPQALDAS